MKMWVRGWGSEGNGGRGMGDIHVPSSEGGVVSGENLGGQRSIISSLKRKSL